MNLSPRVRKDRTWPFAQQPPCQASVSAAFGPQIDDIREEERGRLHDALDKRDGVAVATLLGSPRPQKPRRSFGA
jgi:hypothetical protein